MKVKITGLVDPNKKIQAIKCLRAHTGYGLKESKDIVDAVALGEPCDADLLISPRVTDTDPLDTWFHYTVEEIDFEAAAIAAVLATDMRLSGREVSQLAHAVRSNTLSHAALLIGKAGL